ncbi:MAG: SDR family oxidoreductase [Spirochaetes bacterium]|nr:SDR family oxidoreductase [Spirochaetota bacterium]
MENRILIFGATGGTGRQLVRQALSLGYKVTAFVRDPARLKVSDDNLSVFTGDVRNAEEVNKAVKDHDVVLSALGVKPFNKPICAEAIKNIISAMKKPQKLIVESAYGAGDSKKGIYAEILCFILKPLMNDKNEMEKIILKSNIDYIVVRPTILTNGAKTGRYRVIDEKVKGFPKISRADVAGLMLKLIKENHYKNKCITITY